MVAVLVELELAVVVWGGREGATGNERLGWFNAMKKETLINTANFTLHKFVYLFDLSVSRNKKIKFVFLGVFLVPKQIFHIQAWKQELFKQQWYQIKCKLNCFLILRKDS